MAKSKVGGSRAYIRGRIGADVYSIGKDGKGTRQQVVRSLAEQVSNPRTESQMFGRMVMSTVMQAVSALQPIIDHSFDGLPTGQPSISEFIRQNYALVKADAIAHPADGNFFGLNKYQEKGVKGGKYVVSAGSISLPNIVSAGEDGLLIDLSVVGQTVGALKSGLGLSADGYLTFVSIAGTDGALFYRVSVKEGLTDSETITAENVATLFNISGNTAPTVAFAQNKILFEMSNSVAREAWGAIVSEKVNGAWVHNKCQLKGSADRQFASDVALPTYPTGTLQFLNGGDL